MSTIEPDPTILIIPDLLSAMQEGIQKLRKNWGLEDLEELDPNEKPREKQGEMPTDLRYFQENVVARKDPTDTRERDNQEGREAAEKEKENWTEEGRDTGEKEKSDKAQAWENSDRDLKEAEEKERQWRDIFDTEKKEWRETCEKEKREWREKSERQEREWRHAFEKEARQWREDFEKEKREWRKNFERGEWEWRETFKNEERGQAESWEIEERGCRVVRAIREKEEREQTQAQESKETERGKPREEESRRLSPLQEINQWQQRFDDLDRVGEVPLQMGEIRGGLPGDTKDNAQAKYTNIAASPASDHPLDPPSKDKFAAAHDLRNRLTASLDEATQKILQSPGAMKLLTDHGTSSVGFDITPLNRAMYEGSIRRHPDEETRKAYFELLDFVCSGEPS